MMYSIMKQQILAVTVVLLCVLNPFFVKALAQGQVPLARNSSTIRFGFIEPPVVAQKDITVRAAVSNQQLQQKALECSSLAWLDGQLLILSDRHQHMVFTCPVDLEQMRIAEPKGHIIIKNEQQLLDDAEAVTVHRDSTGRLMVYASCSLSNDRTELGLPRRRHMLSFDLLGTEPFRFREPTVINATDVRKKVNLYFIKAGTVPYRTYYEDTDKNTYRWGNVEGIVFSPTGEMLCGMRNPLHRGKAIVFVLKNIDSAFLERNPERFELAEIFTLELGGRGISDICWDPLTKGFIITAAKSSGPKLTRDEAFPPNTLESAVFWWSGMKSEKPVMFADVPDMKIEAVCRLGTTPYIAIGSDEKDLSEGRTRQQQSVITILYFTGIEQ